MMPIHKCRTEIHRPVFDSTLHIRRKKPMKHIIKVIAAAAVLTGLVGCVEETATRTATDHGGTYQNTCANAVASQVGVSANDVVVTKTSISEGNGDRTIYVGVPNATADWVCITDYKGNVKEVYFGGSEGAM
jgi:hypothetical protein